LLRDVANEIAKDISRTKKVVLGIEVNQSTGMGRLTLQRIV